MFNRRYVFSIITLVAVSIIQSLYFHSIYVNEIEMSAHAYLFYVYAGAISLDGIFFVPAFTFSLTFFLQLCFFTNQIRSDFLVASTYIFTRTKKRTTWLFKHYGRILIQSLLFYTIQFVVTFLFALLHNYEFDVTKCLLCVLFLLCTVGICNTIFTIIASILSVSRNVSLITTLFYLVYTVWIVILPVLDVSSALVSFFPISQALLFLHKDAYTPLGISINDPALYAAKTTFLSTSIFILITVSLVLFISYCWINKKNVMEEWAK